MARMIGKQSEYLWKQEQKFLFLWLVVPLLVGMAGVFIGGYWIGAKTVYPVPVGMPIMAFILLLSLLIPKLTIFTERKEWEGK